MELNEFQKNAEASAFYLGGDKVNCVVYCALGLAEEAGEVVGKVKKLYRDHDGVMTAEWQKAIGNELGDTLWYLSTLAARVGLTLEDVAALNAEKRERRKREGTLNGDGDNR